MPILSPTQIHAVLKQELPEERVSAKRKESKLNELLENANLGLSEVLESLSNNMRCGDTGAVRLAATKTALELNGVMKSDKESGGVNVTIVISEHVGVNPILIPRTA